MNRLASRSWVLLVALAFITPAIFLGISQVSAQSATADWEKAAGGKIAFDAASVKQNTSGPPPVGDRVYTNIPLGENDADTRTRGLLSISNFDVPNLISFAYKLDAAEAQAMRAKLPTWAQQDRFDVEARGPDDATRDQIRLMMQSLLADRFKLSAHFEAHDAPIYNVVLSKPGKTGRQLVPHSDAHPCFDPQAPDIEPPAVDRTAPPCGMLSARRTSDGAISIGSSNVSMQKIADELSALRPAKTDDRPIFDGTGLAGKYDFWIDFPRGVLGAGLLVDEPESSFEELLQDQLGLKLESAAGPVRSLVVDHIEKPSPN